MHGGLFGREKHLSKEEKCCWEKKHAIKNNQWRGSIIFHFHFLFWAGRRARGREERRLPTTRPSNLSRGEKEERKQKQKVFKKAKG